MDTKINDGGPVFPTIAELGQCVVAQDDDCGYSESGYIVCRIGDTAYVYHYSHCSCYGTWEYLSGGGVGSHEDPNARPIPDWHGSWADLVAKARAGECLEFDGRKLSGSDYDFDHLSECYKQILALEARQ